VVSVTEKRKRRIGTVPADWLTESDVVLRGSLETQRVSRIGGPPPGFGEVRVKERVAGPATLLVVSEDRQAAAWLVLELASLRLSVRLAFGLEDVEPLLDGAGAVLAVVPRFDTPVARSLRFWREGRRVYALVPDGETGARLRGNCDLVIVAPWDVASVVKELVK
jgi:hypothetical protein